MNTASIRRFVFNSGTFTTNLPWATFFDVQGLTTEHDADLIEARVVVDGSLPRTALSTVAGTGLIGTNTAFGVVRGTITLGRGRFEGQ